MVEVIVFAKKCPHCKEIMFPVQKMYTSWVECRNLDCPYLFTDAAKNEHHPEDPFPFSCSYMKR